MQHIIRKQTIRLRLNKQQYAFRMQQLVSTHYWQDVVPILEKLFDEASTEDETIVIDTLEIDLGVLTEKEISRSNWSEELLSVLAKQLREKLKTIPSGSRQRAQIQSNSVSICQQWLHYMEKGYLPWNTLYVNDAWKQQVLEALATDYVSVSVLRQILKNNPDALGRIIQQHTDEFLVQLIEILTARKQATLSQLLKELECLWHTLQSTGLVTSSFPGKDIEKELWAHTLKLSATAERITETPQIAQVLLDTFIGEPSVQQAVKLPLSSKLKMLLPIIKAWKKKGKSVDKKDFFENRIREDRASEISKPEREKLLADEGIFVQHAGLVLLHPFLPTFFRRLQLVSAGKFTDDIAQQKSLYLLHYLTTGDAQAEEHELVMPKVLCGYPLRKPVTRHVHITHEEQEEADHLLEEVIRQWERLKNTSLTGLREGFLQRKGKLLTKNDNLYLQVEAHAIDVLLDHLPWSLSIIKLSWIPEFLRVEWR